MIAAILRGGLLLGLVLIAPALARADYLARRGDVLELSVAGAPTMNRRVTVDGNGDITLPVIGQVRATDVGLAELGQRIQALLVARNVVQRGRTIVSVYEYGPVYVDGDVARPGEYRYRPGMTVRAAVALAGGLDVSRGLGRTTAAQASEARADYGATAIDLARQQTRIARLEAELAGTASLNPATITGTQAVPEAILRNIVAAEARQMEAERQARANEKTRLERMLAVARAEVRVLEEAERQHRASYEQAVTEAGRATDLLQRGVGTSARAEASERSLAQARTQLLDVQVRLAQARRETEERDQQLQTFDDQRRANQLELLRDAVAEAAKAQFRLQSARERIASRSDGQLDADGGAAAPEIIVRRLVDGATASLRAGLDTALQPGDSVEVIAAATPTEAAGTRRER
ncbi:polysaccharide biosynthesis/export family protein [Falsiroseomonas sp. HW251]|uniref:polysaccharide biosynthesis/export family protein n=1 Tax=Falsiroseomonas sp. HW251 TaxID=3390998 RepID=UPI003D313262